MRRVVACAVIVEQRRRPAWEFFFSSDGDKAKCVHLALYFAASGPFAIGGKHAIKLWDALLEAFCVMSYYFLYLDAPN